MKKIAALLLVLTMTVSVSGCGLLLHRDYSVVQPHSSTYYESADHAVLRAETYQDVVNDLLLLVGEQEKTGTVWLYRGAEELDAAAIAERACQEVQKQTPLGAYAVEYITYKVDNTPRNYIAIELTLVSPAMKTSPRCPPVLPFPCRGVWLRVPVSRSGKFRLPLWHLSVPHLRVTPCRRRGTPRSSCVRLLTCARVPTCSVQCSVPVPALLPLYISSSWTVTLYGFTPPSSQPLTVRAPVRCSM